MFIKAMCGDVVTLRSVGAFYVEEKSVWARADAKFETDLTGKLPSAAHAQSVIDALLDAARNGERYFSVRHFLENGCGDDPFRPSFRTCTERLVKAGEALLQALEGTRLTDEFNTSVGDKACNLQDAILEAKGA